MKKLWLDMTPYRMRLLVARDASGNGNHTLVVTGEGIAQCEPILKGLGFSFDPRSKRLTYWSRALTGMTLSIMSKSFPAAYIVEMDRERITPAMRADDLKRTVAKAQTQNTKLEQEDGRQSSGDAGTFEPTTGRTPAAGNGEPAILGAEVARDDAGTESENDGAAGEQGGAEELPDAAAGADDGRSSQAGVGLEGAEYSEGVSGGVHGSGELEQPRETARSGSAAEGNGQEPDTSSGRDLTKVVDTAGDADLAEPEQIETATAPEPTPVVQLHPVKPDESESGIDRDWAGCTAKDLQDAYSEDAFYATEVHFKSLRSAETAGIGCIASTAKSQLLSFKGWGGIASDVRVNNAKSSQNYTGNKIADALGMSLRDYDDHVAANRLESFYTPPTLISSIWAGVERLGVEPSSRLLDAGSGAAHFFIGAPASYQRHARMVGVEIDEVAVRFAKAAAPDVTFINKSYESTVLDRNFDAVVGNVPFGETRITDSRYPQASHIHDYFIVRSLDQMRDGGIMAVITSSGTMDKENDGVRQQIMARADLVAAYRLPNQVFAFQNANVTTDILFLQRRPEGTAASFDFTKTGVVTLQKDEDQRLDFKINQYFIDRPDHIIGSLEAVSSQFGMKAAVALPRNRQEAEHVYMGRVAIQLNELIAKMPEGIASKDQWEIAPQGEASSKKENTYWVDSAQGLYLDSYSGFVGDIAIKNGALIEILDIVDTFDADGIRTGHQYLAVPASIAASKLKLMTAYVELRDSARELIRAQFSGSDDALALAQADTADRYEAFTKEYGPVNKPTNIRQYGDDPGSAEVCALEIWDAENGVVKQVSESLSKRVIGVQSPPSIDTPEDAYYHSVDQKGSIDLDFMAEISGLGRAEILADLLGRKIFKNPENGLYEPEDVYLSGNVVKKLEQARQALSIEAEYSDNVSALQTVQPATIPFEDITIRLGNTWIPTQDICEFTGQLFGRKIDPADFNVFYSEAAQLWTVHASSSFKNTHEANRNTLYGTKSASYEVLLEKLLNGQRPTHYVKVEDKSVLDDEATMESRLKQDELNERFNTWVASDGDRVADYVERYNSACNVFVIPRIDGSRLTFPGLAESWKPRPHQCDMVAKALMGYNSMAAHPVGAGKTFEMVAMAIKLKQVGMHSKPAIAVPNHMLGQIASEAKQMYPAARILMVTNDDLSGSNRARFLAISRNNDWDVVVMTHSLLNGISAPMEILLREHETHIDAISAAIHGTDNKRVERRLLAERKTAIGKLDSLKAELDSQSLRAAPMTLDLLGIDMLLVDEAHLYKNLDLNSSMNVLGVTTGGSKRAFNLWAISQYLRDMHGKSSGLHFFTGTPIANTMCEMYVHIKFLRPELLAETGIDNFDQFAALYTEIVTAMEPLPEGGGYKVNERLGRYVNLPEMLKAFRTVADVRSAEELNLPTPKVNMEIISVEQSDWQKAHMKHLAFRASAVREGSVTPDQDNILSIATSGRKAATSMQLIDHNIPEDASLKTLTVANNVFDVWERTSDVKGTQLIFSDMGTPGKGKPYTVYDAIKDALVAKGVPESDVAFIHDAKTDKAKEALFVKVRSGAVRVLIGSTEKMGVGTNVQERLAALHHVDCPWRPADIAQRKGRIDRQGNLYFQEVTEFRYTTKDSFDLFMWSANQRKARFIAEALRNPDSAGRELREEIDLGYAEVMQATTGDEKIREKVEVDEAVRKLQRQERMHLSNQAGKLTAARSFEWDKKSATESLNIELQVKAAIPVTPIKAVLVEGSISGVQDASTTWLTATGLGDALTRRIPHYEAQLMRSNERTADIGVSIGDLKIKLTYDRINKVSSLRGFIAGEPIPSLVTYISKHSQQLGKSLREWHNVEARISDFQHKIAVAQGNLNTLSAAGDLGPWPHVAKLAELLKIKAGLDKYLTEKCGESLEGGDPFIAMLNELHASLRHEPDAYEVFDGGVDAGKYALLEDMFGSSPLEGLRPSSSATGRMN